MLALPSTSTTLLGVRGGGGGGGSGTSDTHLLLAKKKTLTFWLNGMNLSCDVATWVSGKTNIQFMYCA